MTQPAYDPTLQDYPRPELTAAEQNDAIKAALHVINSRDMKYIKSVLIIALTENAKLLKECQIHRTVRNLKPIPEIKGS